MLGNSLPCCPEAKVGVALDSSLHFAKNYLYVNMSCAHYICKHVPSVAATHSKSSAEKSGHRGGFGPWLAVLQWGCLLISPILDKKSFGETSKNWVSCCTDFFNIKHRLPPDFSKRWLKVQFIFFRQNRLRSPFNVAVQKTMIGSSPSGAFRMSFSLDITESKVALKASPEGPVNKSLFRRCWNSMETIHFNSTW